jgi:putative ABC transport system ATP-binding protein
MIAVTAPAILADNLTFAWKEQEILQDACLTVQQGEMVFLCGPSGSGKTTLLCLVGGLRGMQLGSLTVLGERLDRADEHARERLRQQIGYVFQHHNLLGFLTAEENVMMSLIGDDLTHAEKRAAAREALSQVGLVDHCRYFPAQLSGGQRQRVAVARALARNPKLVLADEPTASLDAVSGREVVELLKALARRRGAAVLLVTHDERVVDLADRILHIGEGRIAEHQMW